MDADVSGALGLLGGRMEEGGRRTEDGGWMTEDGGRRRTEEDGGWRTEKGRPETYGIRPSSGRCSSSRQCQ